ncbi:MAG: hypothetical protein RL536_79 [Candidatus Parcubacteria bacterium]
MSKIQSYIFIGRSGCGKGTQVDLLMKKLKQNDANIPILYIQSGYELREFVKGTSYTAGIAREILKVGGLMPEFMPIYLWGKLFTEKFTGKETLVFDGTPRKLMESQILDSLFPFYGLGKPWVIYLDVDHEESTKRLKLRGRSDDGEHEIEKRLAWYETDVAPSIEFYRKNPNANFLDVDGERTIQEIHEDIVKRVGL